VKPFVIATLVAVLAIAIWLMSRDWVQPVTGEPEMPAAETPSSRPDSRGVAGPALVRDVIKSRPSNVLEIEAAWSDGGPASRATVLAFGGEILLGRGVTDDRGVVRLDGDDGAAMLIVASKGAPATITSIPFATGRHRVTLDRGVAITGRVEVDGRPPSAPMEISLQRDGRRPSLPRVVYRQPDLELAPQCMTDERGEFSFTGLEPGSEWRIGVQVNFAQVIGVFRGSEEVIWVSAPASGLVVRAIRYPLITGRVVTGAAHVPVPRARIHYPISFGRKDSVGRGGTFGTGGQSVSCDEAGRFTVPVRVDGESSLVLKAYHPAGVGEKVVSIAPVPTSDQDIGDVVLPEARFVSYVVRDDDGRPIQDALASVDNHVVESSRTDVEGRGQLQVGAEMRSFRIGALRYAIAEVPVPTGSEVIPITLRRSAGIEVVVKATDGALPFGLVVSLLGAGIREKTPFNRPDSIFTELGGSDYSGGGSNSERYRADERGRVFIPGVSPGMFRVTVEDWENRTLASKPITLEAGIWQRLDFEIEARLGKIRGIVTDDRGAAIEDADVFLGENEERLARSRMSPRFGSPATRSDASGRFELENVGASTVTLCVTKEGYVPFSRRGLAVAEGSPEVEVTLKPGRSVDVLVFFENGRPVRHLHDVRGTCVGTLPMIAEERRPGIYRFTGVPEAALQVTVSYQTGRSWEQTVDVATGARELRFVIPTPGAVRVKWEVPAGVSLPCTLRLSDRSASGIGVLAVTRPEDARSGEITFVELLPGDYLAEVQTRDGSFRRGVVDPQHVTVVSGETADVTLRK
jgi:hypothetical protein